MKKSWFCPECEYPFNYSDFCDVCGMREPTGSSTAHWIGPIPETCDICKTKLSSFSGWIDGKTKNGPWANMCPHCHQTFGIGFGTGRGQLWSNDPPHYKLEG